MNTDPKKSAQPCGCDEGAGHVCDFHAIVATARTMRAEEERRLSPDTAPIVRLGVQADGSTRGLEAHAHSPRTIAPIRGLFPASAQGRKDHPVFTGFLMYFPDAIAAVAHVSKMGNDQHNPGQPLHWAREKSTDQMDTAIRHSMDHGVGTTKDTDGAYHLAKAIWRLCAELQLTIEKEREGR